MRSRAFGVAVNPVVAPPERGQDLITDRAAIGSGSVDTEIVAQQLDKRSGARHQGVDRGHVEDGEIHRYPAEQWNSDPADAARAAMAQRTQPAVRIADRSR